MVPEVLPFSDGAEEFHIHPPYLLTFGKVSTNIWRFDGLRHFVHVSPLARCVKPPSDGPGPVIDTDREIIVISDPNYHRLISSPLLLIFSLIDGQLIREFKLTGHLAERPLLWGGGKVLVVTRDGSFYGPTCGLTRALLYDATGSGGLLYGFTLPARLREREEGRLATRGGVLLPILFMPNGDIIATSSCAYHSTMEVLRYNGTTSISQTDADVSEPDASISLVTSHEYFYCIHPTCSALLDAQSFLVAVHEADIDQLPQGDAYQTAVYAIDAETMSVRWRSAYVGGIIHDLHFVAEQNVVLAFGTHDTGAPRRPDVFEYVLVLDPTTGTEQFTDRVSHRIQDASIKYCGLTHSADNFIVIAVLEDGSICAVDLEQFLEQAGFPRDGQLLESSEPLQGDSLVKAAGVSERIVVFSVGTSDGGSSEIRYSVV